MTRPVDPAACRVVLTRHPNGALACIAIIMPPSDALAAREVWDEDEIARLIALARDEAGADPHDDRLPPDDALIRAALRDLGIPIQGEEDETMTEPPFPATVAASDPHQRGLLWFYGFDAPEGAWEPVVFERTGNRSLGRFTDAIEATRAWHAAMDCPADIALPEGWTWDRVREERARWGIGPEMVPETSVSGVATAWGHVNFARKHNPAPMPEAELIELAAMDGA